MVTRWWTSHAISGRPAAYTTIIHIGVTACLWAAIVYPVRVVAQSRVASSGLTVITPTLRAGIDTTVSPCDDFDQYANGAWRATQDSTPINIFEEGIARIDSYLLRLLDSAVTVASRTRDPVLRTLGTFYASCLATDSLPAPRSRTPSRRAVTTRAEACLVVTEQVLGPALRAAYVQDVMRPRVVTEGRRIVSAIHTAVQTQVRAIEWLGDSLQNRLGLVLDTMMLRIPFAPEAPDYSTLTLTPKTYTRNIAAIAAWEAALPRRRDSLSLRYMVMAPVPAPYLVEAQASQDVPVIDVTAALFRPPFFIETAEPAETYATLGVTLAHETWHLLSPYFKWTNNTEGRRRVTQLVKNYARFGDSGWNTVKEDVSDLGGLLAAYTAWQQDGRLAKDRIEGFRPDQRFFLYYARHWRSTQRTRWDRDHSGMHARINGVLMHVPAFATAFGCRVPDAMVVPETQRVEIF